MVSTRNHPKNFPPPDLSPSKSVSPPSSATPSKTRSRSSRSTLWAHTPSNLALVWLAVSLPLVAWDTGYVLLRPHTMPGGKFHWPLYTPYALYGTVDYIYGWPAWEANNGFTAAQGSMNIVESLLYGVYLWVVLSLGGAGGRGGRGATGGKGKGVAAWFGKSRVVKGRAAALASLLGLVASVMTVSKTVLYMLNESFSGFHNIGHNDLSSLIFLWIIPNGAWIVLPTYMSYIFIAEVYEGLAIASGAGASSISSPILLAIKDE